MAISDPTRLVMRGLDPRIYELAGATCLRCEHVDGRIKSGHDEQANVYTVGLMFWFRRNRFVGSYWFFNATSRS